MAEWKPTFYVTNGKPGAIAPLRKFARKLLEQSKTYNEEYGSYANPVRRFSYKETKFVVSSLPGYDIIEITTPSPEGEEEVGGKAEIYSGLWEPRLQAGGFGHYLKWYPSDYEIFNTGDLAPVAKGLGASVDGAAVYIDADLPPARWMYNDYSPGDPDDTTDGRQEAPWFKETGQVVSAASIHPGKYSGKLRELVQMQLGYGLLPQFSYSASNSNGIHLETLDEDTTRIWLYQISATNGVVMQIMMDYSVAKFEKAAKLKTGAIPPEIEEAGFFALQTSFDSSKPVYTKAEWDALPDDERPDIRVVTFELLSAAAYLSVTAEYGAYGDYGWSFNPAGTSAVFCGMAWNTVSPGTPALNYKSNILTVTLNPTAFSASVSGGGDNAFLMNSALDHVKFPNSNGNLESVYFWKGENGFKGTQPSNSYSAPIYTYYNLNGELVTCNYEWDGGVTETRNGGSAFVLNWASTIACRQQTTWGVEKGAGNYHYAACTDDHSGTGTFGQKHGFSTQITTPDSYDIFTGFEAQWITPIPWGNKARAVWFNRSFGKKVPLGPVRVSTGYVNIDEHWYARTEGSHGGSTKSVLIIPSFERLAFYHYKTLNTNMTNGKIQYPHSMVYERGTPVRQNGLGGALGDDCEYANCGWEIFGNTAHRAPDQETTAEYYINKNSQPTGLDRRNMMRMTDLYLACSEDENHDCFSSFEEVVPGSRPQDTDPWSFDVTTLVGGLMLPDGSSIAFSDDEITTDSKPFRESSSSFGYQSVISCFDTFSSKYIFSMPNIALTALKHTATGFPSDFTKVGVLFSGMPYFL